MTAAAPTEAAPAAVYADVPPAPRLLYGWQDGYIVLHVVVEGAAAEADASAAIAAGRSRLDDAAAAARSSPAWAEAERLAAAAGDADGRRRAAERKAEAAMAEAQKALAAGDDPAAHEKNEARARHDAGVFAARAAHLAPLLAAARRKASAEADAAEDAAWRDLLAESAARRGEVLERLSAAVEAPLAELLAIDAAENRLYDPDTGGPPARRDPGPHAKG